MSKYYIVTNKIMFLLGYFSYHNTTQFIDFDFF